MIRFREEKNVDNSLTVVLYHKGKDIGYVNLKMNGSMIQITTLQIYSINDSRKGYGTKLIKHGIKRFKTSRKMEFPVKVFLNPDSIGFYDSDVRLVSEDIINFYKKNGFRPDPDIGKEFKLSTLFMSKIY